jgi:hypothetical protein
MGKALFKGGLRRIGGVRVEAGLYTEIFLKSLDGYAESVYHFFVTAWIQYWTETEGDVGVRAF